MPTISVIVPAYMAIRLYPPILRESWTQNLLIKALLLR
jgi:hypothetical protein